MTYAPRTFPRPRAFTLVEIMVTLMIFAVVATAAMSLLASSGNTQQYALNNMNAVSQTELLFRRIVENLRSASSASCITSSEVDLVTQPDTAVAGNPVYNVSYSTLGSQLLEFDDRYGTNTLAQNVTAFSISVFQSAKPTTFLLTLTITPPDCDPITRTAFITSRNF